MPDRTEYTTASTNGTLRSKGPTGMSERFAFDPESRSQESRATGLEGNPAAKTSHRENLLIERMASLGSCVVAFSGGADSALALAAAVRGLGRGNVIAATAVSPSLADAELRVAQKFAATLGVKHLTPSTHEMEREGYRANSGSRCYFCKSELLDTLLELAHEKQLAHVVTGTNADDAADPFRPGIRAADERGVVAPLRDLGFTKDEVRAISRAWGLATWDKPAMPCLASRLAYGVEVTKERLARVERAEVSAREALAEANTAVTDLRVRDLGDRVRIEVDQQKVDEVTAIAAVRSAVRAAGFGDAAVEIGAFRSGSMNDALTVLGKPEDLLRRIRTT